MTKSYSLDYRLVHGIFSTLNFCFLGYINVGLDKLEGGGILNFPVEVVAHLFGGY